MIDLYTIQSATQRAKDYTDETVARVQRYLVDDADKDKRTEQGYCKWCWYRRITAMTGQMFTKFTCRRCDSEHMYHNTGAPALCRACVVETKLCASCCGDINGKQRKKLVRRQDFAPHGFK